jgi:hypothetical protein
MKALIPLLLVVALALLSACATRSVSPGSVMEAASTGTSARTLECLNKNADGTCNVKQCTQGPGGPEYDCAGYAADCVNAGQHWSGTKEGGKCTRVL